MQIIPDYFIFFMQAQRDRIIMKEPTGQEENIFILTGQEEGEKLHHLFIPVESFFISSSEIKVSPSLFR